MDHFQTKSFIIDTNKYRKEIGKHTNKERDDFKSRRSTPSFINEKKRVGTVNEKKNIEKSRKTVILLGMCFVLFFCILFYIFFTGSKDVDYSSL